MKLDPNSSISPTPPQLCEIGTVLAPGDPGLTVRAHFASLAMQGAIASGLSMTSEDVAEWSVECVDALIAELNKDAPPPMEARDGLIIGWAVKHGIRDLSNKDLRAAFEAARNLELSKP